MTDREYSVVCPATEETAAVFGGTDFEVALLLCNKLAEEHKGNEWQVHETRVIYRRKMEP